MSLLTYAQPLGPEFSSDPFGHVEDMFHFGDVILSVEERPERLQIDLRSDAQRCFRFSYAMSDDKTTRAHFEKSFGLVLRFVMIERHGVRERFLARAQRGLQNADAARIAIQLAGNY